MLYVLYGNDFEKARSKLRDIINAQKKKNPNASFFRMDSDSWDKSRFEELIGGMGLFQSRYIAVLDNLLSDKSAGPVISENLSACAGSENIFVVIEEIIGKDLLAKLKKYSGIIQLFSKKSGVSGKPFSVFSLADALGNRDGKKLWVLYQKGVFSGLDPEEIHRILFWQIKSIIVASESADAKSAGLNPFVFRKAKDFAKNYSKQELKKFSGDLVAIYHNARKGKGKFANLLERFVLGI
jgi:DNA polymerase III delta subunit